MRLFLSIFMVITLSFSFHNSKIENLMGEKKFNNYNKLLDKIFEKKEYSIYEILVKLENNGLLELFFDKARILHTKFIFNSKNLVFTTKILNNSLTSLGYYYFYFSDIENIDDKYTIVTEFKSEHFIDPVSFINEIQDRGCRILDVDKENDMFIYSIDCADLKVKESSLLDVKNRRYVNSKGIYWLKNNSFSKIKIKTKKIDYWHPSVWFYDKSLNLLNYRKINRKVTNLTLSIPPACKYIKIIDIYSGENFKRGIIVKGLK